MDSLFITACMFMGMHVVSSRWLFSLIRNDPVAVELFAQPNAWIAQQSNRLPLLRLKFVLPWVAVPDSMEQQSLFVRFLFHLARFAGGAFPCVMMVFLIRLFIQ